MAEASNINCISAARHSSTTDGNESNERVVENEEVATTNTPECAVCLQSCIHPARLPCNHVFCFLCIKGVANQSKRCPMCRHEIPLDFLERPQLVEVETPQQTQTEEVLEEVQHEEYQWYYEGRNGWWQYDRRTSAELETAYKDGRRSCEVLIAGFLYVADFSSMFQYRRNDHSRKRRIKRDLYNTPNKGVAGLRLNNASSQEQNEGQPIREIRGAERPPSPTNDNTGDGTNTPIPPSNTPQTPAGGTTSGNVTPSTAIRLMEHRSDSLHQINEHRLPGTVRRSIPIRWVRRRHALVNVCVATIKPRNSQ